MKTTGKSASAGQEREVRLTKEEEFDELLKKRIGEAFRSKSEREKLDLEVLREWAAEDRRKKALRHKRWAAAAAAVVLTAGTIIGADLLKDRGEFYAEAGNNDPVISESDGNTIIKNNDEGAEENPGMETVTIDDWEMVLAAKEKYPDLLIPEYVPEGYEFQQLVIEDSGMIESYVFVFANKEETLEITETLNADLTIFNNYDREIESKVGKIYVDKVDDRMRAFKKEQVSVYMISDCSEYEIIKIVEHFK